MLLTPEQLAWLRERLVPQANPDDLQKTYEFEHALNQTRRLARVFQSEPRGDQCNQFRWWVLFFCTGEQCLTQDQAPIARSIRGGTRLLSCAKMDLVAYNEHIALEQTLQGQGFSSALYEAEERLYKAWNVREIHLTALGAGRTVWLKARFGFKPVRPGLLAESFGEWAHKHGKDPSVPPAPHLYPSAFLDELTELKLFKVLP